MSLHDDLRAFLAEQGIDLSGDDGDSADLLESGLLDSQALFELVLWIEERTGEPVDPTQFDLAREWASVRDILAFVEERGRRSR